MLHSDRGGESLSGKFEAFFETYGIQREFTTPYTSQQNGVAERKNRTVVEMARIMMAETNLEKRFWAEVASTEVYLLNTSPTRFFMHMTPYEAWKGRKPQVSHLRIFGRITYALVSSYHKKLFDKSLKCIFFWDIAPSPKHI